MSVEETLEAARAGINDLYHYTADRNAPGHGRSEVHAETLSALARLHAEIERQGEALREIAGPIVDATFRARLLRQGLSTDEMAQYVECVESLQARAREALAQPRQEAAP
jgi:anti-sigma factor RsiW